MRESNDPIERRILAFLVNESDDEEEKGILRGYVSSMNDREVISNINVGTFRNIKSL